MSHAITKLRRAIKTPLRAPAPHASDAVLWRGIGLDTLGHALAQTHHVQYVWKQLALTVSQALQDHAVALIQAGDKTNGATLLADDGLHDELRRAISAGDSRCPFLRSPATHIDDLALALENDPEARLLYELIEHYWGWRITRNTAAPVYLMLFGPEVSPPHRMALDACHLSSFVASHAGTEIQRRQLISDLSAETQGKRILPADALKNRLDQWLPVHDAPK